MGFVKKFNQKHYKVYLEKIEEFINGFSNIDEWIKNFGNKELENWIRVIHLYEANSDEYYEEFSILLTILIKFFIIELDIEDNGIKLKDSQIEKMIFNFKYALYREYSNRYDVEEHIDEEYILLK